MGNDVCKIREHSLRGFHAITLENETMAVVVLPERGAEIHAILYKPKTFDLLWKTPWGLRRPNRVLAADGGAEAAWLDCYGGGWQGLFPNGGDSCVYRNATLGFHGEASTAEWEYRYSTVEDSARIEMDVALVRSPFTLRREVSVERSNPVVSVKDIVVNQSDIAIKAMWGHHPAFATEFISGARIQTSARKFHAHEPEVSHTTRFVPGREYSWPAFTGKNGSELDLSYLPNKTEQIAEMGYLSDFETGRLLLCNDSLGLSAELLWDIRIFPYVWYWLEWGGTLEYPWYGRCRVAAFEPFSSIPGVGLARAIECGTAMTFNPNQQISTEISLQLHPH